MGEVLSSPFLLAIIFSFLLAFMLVFLLQHKHFARLALDQPNHRSLHTCPVPRTGGLGVMAGVMTGWLVMRAPSVWPLAAAVLFLMIVSFLDDLRGLPALWRFCAHFLAAGAILWLLNPGGLGIVQLLIFIPAIVWMTNLYNFMDGADGLAGGMAVLGFGFYGWTAWLHGDMSFASLNWSISGAALAFLFFNFHPARIFMGDAGSIPLGFLAAVLGLLGWHQGLWPLWFPPLVFSPFVVDASITLIKRLLRREKVWQAHREHYYQRLVQMGYGHRLTALAEYLVMLGAGAAGLWLIGQSPLRQLLYGFGCLAFYGIVAVFVDKRWSAFRILPR